MAFITVDRFKEAYETSEGVEMRWTGSDWRAPCPAHKGEARNFSIKAMPDGYSKGTCFSEGCKEEAIMAAIGITAYKPKTEVSVADIAAAKGIPPEALLRWGVSDGTYSSTKSKCVDIPYMDEAGEVVAIQKRISLDVDPRFKWAKEGKQIPYGLWRLQEMKKVHDPIVILVEGASDCWAGWLHGIPVIGLAGSNAWKEKYSDYFEGFTPYGWREPGLAGDKFINSIARDLPDLRIINAPPNAKDISALREQDTEGFKANIKELIQDAVPYSNLLFTEQSREILQLKDAAKQVLDYEDMLPKLIQSLSAKGYAGDTRPPAIVYAGLTSRLLQKPINIVIIAMSASGKNAAIDAAVEFMPESAYVKIDASSPKVFIYNNEDYKNKIVIFKEADSIPEDGAAASAMRSLMEDDRMEYEVVIPKKEGEPEVHKIVKEGPTGLLTTFTKPLGAQASTRTLQLSISDSPDLTRDILRTFAKREAGEEIPDIDLEPWIAFQKLLALEAPYDVVVPFGLAIAELVPVQAVRMRRDFKQVLNVIKVLAVLRKHQREKDKSGRLIATLNEDYRDARWLLQDVYSTITSEGLTDAIRETVVAVKSHVDKNGSACTHADLKESLGVALTTIKDRTTKAIAGGWLRNDAKGNQTRKLYPTEQALEIKTMPEVEEVRAKLDDLYGNSTDSIEHLDLGRSQNLKQEPPIGSSLESHAEQMDGSSVRIAEHVDRLRIRIEKGELHDSE